MDVHATPYGHAIRDINSEAELIQTTGYNYFPYQSGLAISPAWYIMDYGNRYVTFLSTL